MDLDAIGADSGKKVDIDGLVIPEIALGLRNRWIGFIQYLDISQGLSAANIRVGRKGVRVDQQLEVLVEQSEFSGNIEEESLVDPVEQAFVL